MEMTPLESQGSQQIIFHRDHLIRSSFSSFTFGSPVLPDVVAEARASGYPEVVTCNDDDSDDDNDDNEDMMGKITVDSGDDNRNKFEDNDKFREKVFRPIFKANH